MGLHRNHTARRSDRMIRLSAVPVGTVTHNARRAMSQVNVR